MSETYTFTARIAVRHKTRIIISPDDRDAFLDYVAKVGLLESHYQKDGKCLVAISKPEFLAAAGVAVRIRFSVEKWGHRLRGIKLEPLH